MQNHVRDQIEDYLAGVIDPEALRNFEQHIRICRSCEEAFRDTQDALSYLKWLLPLEAPPEPGPDFYFRVQNSIEKKLDSGWFARFAAALHGPRLAYPLLFLLLGLILTAWTMTFPTESSDSGVLGIPLARYSVTISSEADRMRSREMVMVSLMETLENNKRGAQ